MLFDVVVASGVDTDGTAAAADDDDDDDDDDDADDDDDDDGPAGCTGKLLLSLE